MDPYWSCKDWKGNDLMFLRFDMSIMSIYETDFRTECFAKHDPNYYTKYGKALRPSSYYTRSQEMINYINDDHLKQLSESRLNCIVMKKDDILDIMGYYKCENQYQNLLSTLNVETVDEYVFMNVDTIEEYLNGIGAIDKDKTNIINEDFEEYEK